MRRNKENMKRIAHSLRQRILLLTIEPVKSEGKGVSHIPRYILGNYVDKTTEAWTASFNGLFEGGGMPLLWHGVRDWSKERPQKGKQFCNSYTNIKTLYFIFRVYQFCQLFFKSDYTSNSLSEDVIA